MPSQVNVSPKVERQLAVLEKQENAPAIAAARAKRIIDALIRGKSPASGGLLKRKTDKRVKNCLKFDLGKGFRMICVKEEKTIYVLFVGDHDNCDNWLDNYSKKKPHKTGIGMKTYTIDRHGSPVSKKFDSVDVPFDDTCFPRITQKALRQVFKGLIE